MCSDSQSLSTIPSNLLVLCIKVCKNVKNISKNDNFRRRRAFKKNKNCFKTAVTFLLSPK